MDLTVLKDTPLFDGIAVEDLAHLVKCQKMRVQCFKAGAILFRADESPHEIGFVLSGSIRVETYDWEGHTVLYGTIWAGLMFMEETACLKGARLRGNVIANEPCEILFFHYPSALENCSCGCHFHKRLIENMFSILARKGQLMLDKIMHFSKRNTRGRILSYLHALAGYEESKTIELHYDRQQLADYLAINRSAMIVQLGKLQKEGLIKVEKNKITLIRGGHAR